MGLKGRNIIWALTGINRMQWKRAARGNNCMILFFNGTIQKNPGQRVKKVKARDNKRGMGSRKSGITTTTITEILPGTAPAVLTPQGTVDAGENEGGGETSETGDTALPESEEELDNGGEERPPLQQIGDGEVPLAGQDLKDLDEEEVPAGNIQADKVFKKGLPLAACIAIAVSAAAALAVLFAVRSEERRVGKECL